MRTLLGFAFIALLHGQELAFDVASIKPIESDRSTDRFLMTAGRTLRSSGNTYALISWAYQAEDIRLEGLPEWFSYQYYVLRNLRAPNPSAPTNSVRCRGNC